MYQKLKIVTKTEMALIHPSGYGKEGQNIYQRNSIFSLFLSSITDKRETERSLPFILLKLVNIGVHPSWQNHVLTQLRKYDPDTDTSFEPTAWKVMEQLNLTLPLWLQGLSTGDWSDLTR